MSEMQPKIMRTDNGTKRLATTVAAPQATAAATNAAISANPQARRAAKRRIVLLAGLAIATFVYVGGQRRAIGPSAGVLEVRTIVAAVPADQPAKLRIGTYNIHMGKGTDGRTDLSRIAGVIGGLDFVGLNEVLGAAPWEQEDQAATLGKELKMTSLYTPTEERWWTAKFGNGYLSKLDVRSWQVVPLERRHGKSFRNLVHIRAKGANGTPLNIVVTHIDRSDDRERHEQLRAVGEYFLSLQKPAILLGDMNTDAHEPVMIKLLEGTDIVDALGKAKGFNAPRHIDWILTRGLEVKDAGMSPVGPSDHAHVWAELEVPAANRDVKSNDQSSSGRNELSTEFFVHEAAARTGNDGAWAKFEAAARKRWPAPNPRHAEINALMGREADASREACWESLAAGDPFRGATNRKDESPRAGYALVNVPADRSCGRFELPPPREPKSRGATDVMHGFTTSLRR